MKIKNIYKIVLIGICIFVAGLLYVVYITPRHTPIQMYSDINEEVFFEEDGAIVDSEDTYIVKTETDNEVCIVHIAGAVYKPDVYQLPLGSRIYEVIELAGGATEEADLDQINLAMKIKDEQKIYVPFLGEIFDKSDKENNNNSIQLNNENIHKININQASEKELETLPGIGPVTATNIVQYREEYGDFQKIEDIQKVSRIGIKTFDKIKMMIAVD